MQKRITTQLLMQDIFAQVRSIYRYIYWSDRQLYRAILNRFPDSDDILLCIGCGVGEGKVFIMIPAHLPSSHRHTWHRVTSWHLVTTPSQSVVTIISSQSGPGPGHSPRTPLLPPWSVDISHVHYLKIFMIFISLWNALYLIKLNIGMLLVKVRPSLPSARKVEQRGGATWPGCCCWPEWPGNFLSCLAFICSQHQHSTAGHSAQ